MYRDDLIRAAQAAQNLTVEDVAEKSGLNKNTVSDIRNGKENIELPSLAKIANALGLRMEELFSSKSDFRRAA